MVLRSVISIVVSALLMLSVQSQTLAFMGEECEEFEEEFAVVDSLLQDSMWSTAELKINEILDEDPDCYAAKIALGKVPYYRGWDDQALSYFNDLIQSDSTRYQPYHYRGMIFLEQGDETDALIEFHKALEANPQLGSGYYFNTISPLLTEGQRLQPDRLDTLTQIAPNLSSIYVSWGMFYYFRENYSEALEYFDKALEINRDNAGGWYYSGRCYDNLDERTRARNAYNQAISRTEEFAAAYYFRGMLKLRTGDWNRGCNDLQTADYYEHTAAGDALREMCRRRFY